MAQSQGTAGTVAAPPAASGNPQIGGWTSPPTQPTAGQVVVQNMPPAPPSAGQLVVTGMQATPGILLSLLVTVVVVMLRRQIVAGFTRLIERTDSVEAFGIKLSLKAFDAAVKERGAVAHFAGANGRVVATRLSAERKSLENAEILWIDDQPSNNRVEAKIFTSLGAQITFAASSEEAWRLIERGAFDLIISDISRPAEELVNGIQPGIALLNRIRENRCAVPFVFYTGKAEAPVPDGAQDVTDRPDTLTLAVLDSLKSRG